MLTVIYQPRANLSAKERGALEYSYAMFEAFARSYASRGHDSAGAALRSSHAGTPFRSTRGRNPHAECANDGRGMKRLTDALRYPPTWLVVMNIVAWLGVFALVDDRVVIRVIAASIGAVFASVLFMIGVTVHHELWMRDFHKRRIEFEARRFGKK